MNVPTNSVLLNMLITEGPGGYWSEPWGNDGGKLNIVFPYRTGGNGFHIVDATPPTNLIFLTYEPLPSDESSDGESDDFSSGQSTKSQNTEGLSRFRNDDPAERARRLAGRLSPLTAKLARFRAASQRPVSE